MSMPPRERGSIRTWRSERTSAPQWPASPVRVSVATVMRRTPLSAQLGQYCIRHLRRAGSALADGLGATRNAHHIVSAHLAFFHHRRDRGTDAAGLLDFADVLQHHDCREKHRDRVYDGRVEFGILGCRAVRGLEDGNFIADVARS